METTIIISIGIIILLAGVACVYYGGQYLYELYVEYFTTDPDPDSPETPVRSTWEEKFDIYRNKAINQINQIPELTDKLISGIFEWNKKLRRNKRLRFGVPNKPTRAPRPNRPPPRPQKPIKKNTPRTPRWESSEDYYKMRDDILGIDPADRGGGRDVWDAKRTVRRTPRRTADDTWDTKRR